MKNFIKGIVVALALAAGITIFGDNVYAKDAEGNVVIVIDPGHGGEDPGAQAVTGAFEDDCNYLIAVAMKNELCKYEGVKVYLTREADSWITNTGRAMIAANLNADFLISLHNNSGSSTNTGALAYRSLNEYYAEATNDMCTLILDNLAELGLKNGGVQTRTSTTYDYEDYYTIIGEGVRAGVPSIIVEHCFLSNPEDAALISNPDGSLKEAELAKMGVADAKAVVSYFKLEKKKAIADNNTMLEIEKGYSVVVECPDDESGITWYSTNQNVATVDNDGVVTAVGAGVANIVYQLSGGDSGTCTVTVNKPKELAVVGALDPTFYQTEDNFKALKRDDIFAYVIYSDGSALKVKPESIGNIDFGKVGIQDVEIKYGDLTGSVRICYNSDAYVPQVTLPQREEPSQEETTTENVTTTEAQEKEDNSDNNGFFADFGKYIIILAVVIAVGVIITIVEIKKKKRRRRNRSRKYL